MAEIESSIALLLSVATIALVLALAIAYAAASWLWPARLAAARAQLRGDVAPLRARIADAVRATPLIDMAIVAALFALAVWLRARDLTLPIGTDEAATWLYYASKPLLIGVTIWSSPNNHLLNTLLMHVCGALFGPNEWALRLPAFLGGLAIVPLTYGLSRALYRRGALVATAFAAAAPSLIAYSTDGRGYTLMTACALLAALSMCAVVRDGNRAAGIVFALATALGFYAVLLMLTAFLMIVTWAAIEAPARRREVAAASLLGVALTLLIYFPVLVVSGPMSIVTNGYHAPVPLGAFAGEVVSTAPLVAARLLLGFPIALQLAVGVGFVAALLLHRRLSDFRFPIWIGFLLVAALTVAQRHVPPSRIWLVFLPFVFITASAVAPPVRTGERILALGFALLLAYAATRGPRPRETGDFRMGREVSAELGRRLRPGDAVATLSPSDTPLAFYLRRAGFDVDPTKPVPSGARHIFVVTNLDARQTFAKTTFELRIDVARFAVRRIADYGAAEIYELVR